VSVDEVTATSVVVLIDGQKLCVTLLINRFNISHCKRCSRKCPQISGSIPLFFIV